MNSTTQPEVQSFFHAATCTYSYVTWDPATLAAAIIDPVLDYDPAAGSTGTSSANEIAKFVRNRQLELQWILETHAHADHLTAAPWLQQEFPQAEIAIGRGITEVQLRFKEIFNLEADFIPDGSQFDRLLDEGDTLPLGELEIRVLETPGHTSDSLTYLIADTAFVGDSIFMPDMGTARVDFPGGDAATLYASIQKLFALPDETKLYVCHDYAPGGRKHDNVTTVAEEKAGNIHVGAGNNGKLGKNGDEFTRMRKKRDATLGSPRLLYPAVQVNIRAGRLPPAESNGIAYLKIPLNRFGKEN